MKRVYTACVLFMVSFHSIFGQNGELTYKTYCSGCHGAQMQGGTASKLIKTDWIKPCSDNERRGMTGEQSAVSNEQ